MGWPHRLPIMAFGGHCMPLPCHKYWTSCEYSETVWRHYLISKRTLSVNYQTFRNYPTSHAGRFFLHKVFDRPAMIGDGWMAPTQFIDLNDQSKPGVGHLKHVLSWLDIHPIFIQNRMVYIQCLKPSMEFSRLPLNGYLEMLSTCLPSTVVDSMLLKKYWTAGVKGLKQQWTNLIAQTPDFC